MEFISGVYLTAVIVTSTCLVSLSLSAKEFVKMYQKENGT